MIFISLILSCSICAQEFSFQLIFEDAIGNLDTLILGYDVDATDSVDHNFGEINIITQEIDSIFDVRVTDEWNAGGWWFGSTGNYHLKKQILKKNCGSWPTALSIDIKCNNWPVTATWDSSLFTGNCRKGSVLTSVPQGGWWDVGSPSNMDRSILIEKNSVSFTANWKDYVNSSYAYINNNQDTISVFWVAFMDTSHLWINVEDYTFDESLSLFPNPARDYIFVRTSNIQPIKQIEVYNLMGKIQSVEYQDDVIDVRSLMRGVYILRFITKDNELIVRKIFKY